MSGQSACLQAIQVSLSAACQDGQSSQAKLQAKLKAPRPGSCRMRAWQPASPIKQPPSPRRPRTRSKGRHPTGPPRETAPSPIPPTGRHHIACATCARRPRTRSLLSGIQRGHRAAATTPATHTTTPDPLGTAASDETTTRHRANANLRRHRVTTRVSGYAAATQNETRFTARRARL